MVDPENNIVGTPDPNGYPLTHVIDVFHTFEMSGVSGKVNFVVKDSNGNAAGRLFFIDIPSIAPSDPDQVAEGWVIGGSGSSTSGSEGYAPYKRLVVNYYTLH